MIRPRVAVIGLGVSGIAAVKNLREAGFDAIGFDRNPYAGGLWVYTKDQSQTSVLRTTRTNTSKQFSCYHDYPFADDVADYPTASQVADYLEAYAKQNNLYPFFRLGTVIQRISRADNSWTITTDASTETFDRVLVATGPFAKAQWPKLKADAFHGVKIHAQEYKGWEEFEGKRVAVLGAGSTGADIAVDLAGHAEVFLSHRGGARIMKRYQSGRPGDHLITRRRMQMALSIASLHPALAQKGSTLVLDHLMKKSWPELDPSWKLTPAPPAINSPGAISDDLIPCLADGSVKSVSGVESYTATGAVFADEGEVELDAVIFCTGFTFNYDILAPEADPCQTGPSDEWDSKTHNGLKFPYLYMTHFHLDYPNSLAFMGPMGGPSFAALCNADLSSQAIAQVWAGNYDLPPREEMMKWCQRIYQRNLETLKTGRIMKPNAAPGELEPWLCAAAGNGLNEATGWGWEGWKFQASDLELHSLLKDGIVSPHMYRLFDGRPGSRTKWPHARDAILKANGR